MSKFNSKIISLFFINHFLGNIYSKIVQIKYGLDEGDLIFDRFNSEIDLEFSYDYTGFLMSHIYIKNNGYLQNKVPYELIDKESMLTSTGSPIFLASIDPNIGKIYYRIINKEDTKTFIDKLIRDCFSNMNDYSSTFNFVATWDQVVESNSIDHSVNNTFQVIFSSNSRNSFFLHNYLNLNWGNEKNGGGLSTYRAEYYLDDSFTKNVKNLQLKSNIGIPGSFLIGVNNSTHFLPDSLPYDIPETSTK